MTEDRSMQAIAALIDADQCDLFEKNALKQNRHDLVVAARKRALELRAKKHNATTDVERECLEAIYAYEKVLTQRNGKKTYATRTWPMVKRHGIIAAVEKVVCRKDEAMGYTALAEMGLQAYAFEAVILRYPEAFSVEAISFSKKRLGSNE